MDRDLFEQYGISNETRNEEPRDLFAEHGIEVNNDSDSNPDSPLFNNIARPILRTARNAASSLAGFPGDAINSALGLSPVSKSVENFIDKATNNTLKPRNKVEEYVDEATKLATIGGSIGTAAKFLEKGGSKLASKIAESLSIKTPQELAALGGSSLAIPAAEDVSQKILDTANIAPDSALRPVADISAGLIGGVVGGIGGAKATNIPVNLKNYRIKSNLPESEISASNKLGRAKVANQVIKDLENRGITPQEIHQELNSDAGIGLDPIDINKSNINNIEDLAQIAASRKILKNAFDSREQRIIKTQNDILKGVEPDENALSKLSETYIENLKNKMHQNAKPLYEQAFENAKFKTIPKNTTIINKDGDEIKLEDVLSRPDMQQALKKSKLAALNAQGTSAAKFYQKSTPGLKDTNPIVLHNLQSYLRRNAGNLDKLLPDVDEASLMAKRGDVLQFLDENVPGYKDARNTYSADLDNLLTAQKGTKGIIANLQADKGIEAANKLYKLSPNEINKVKSQLIAVNSGKYESAIKAFIDQRISTLRENQTVGNLIKNPQDKAKLQALFPNKETFDGFEKAINYIERTKPVQDVLKKALNKEIKSATLVESIPQNESLLGKGVKAIPRIAGKLFINPISDKVSSQILLQEGLTRSNIKSVDAKQAQTMANYAFTDEGKELFKQLAKTKKKSDIDNLMSKIYLQSGFLSTLSHSRNENADKSLQKENQENL